VTGRTDSAAQDRLEQLEAVAEAAERYLAASNTLAFRPTKEVETAAAQAHHDLTEALNALPS
jgi:hypothetical protein